VLSQVINRSTLDGGCTDFSRVLRPKIEKMGTLKKNRDPKSEKGPHGDPGPQMGTQVPNWGSIWEQCSCFRGGTQNLAQTRKGKKTPGKEKKTPGKDFNKSA